MSNLPHGQGRSIYSTNPAPQNVRYGIQGPPQPQHQPIPRQQTQLPPLYNHTMLPHPHPHVVDPHFQAAQATSTDVLISRLMEKIAPILGQHQAYYTARLGAIETSILRALEPISRDVRQLETDLKGFKDQLESNKKDLYERLGHSDKNQRRDMQSLANRQVKLEKMIGKGYELPGKEMSLTEKLDSIGFAVDELVESYRDPGCATEPVIRHDVAIDAISDAPMPSPPIHHDMATSPIPESAPEPERNPETSLKAPEPELARYTDMGISPIKQTQRFPRTPPSSTTPEPEPPVEPEIEEEAEEDASTTIYTTTTFSPVDWTNKDVFKRYQQFSIPPPPFSVSIEATRIDEESDSQVESARNAASASCEREPEPEDDLFNFSPPPKKASIIDPQDDLLNFDSAIASTPYPTGKPVTRASSSPIDFDMHVPSSRSPSPMTLPRHLMPNATQDEEDFVAQMIGIPPPPTPGERQDTSPAPAPTSRPTSRAHTYTSDVDDDLSDLSSLSTLGSDDDDQVEPPTKRRRVSSSVKRGRESPSTSTTPRGRLRRFHPIAQRNSSRPLRVKKEGETSAGKEKKKRKHRRIKWPEIVQDEAAMSTLIECDNPECKCWFHIGCVGYRADDPLVNDEAWRFTCPGCVAGKKLKPQFRGTEEACARPHCPKHQQGQDNNEFFVSRIIGRKTKVESGKGKSYLWLIRWLNYPVHRATWETSDSLASGAQTLIEEFDCNVREERIRDDKYSVVLLKEAVDGGWSVDEPDAVPRVVS